MILERLNLPKRSQGGLLQSQELWGLLRHERLRGNLYKVQEDRDVP